MADAFGGSFVYNRIGGSWVHPPCHELVVRCWTTSTRSFVAGQGKLSRAEVIAWKVQNNSLISRLR